MAQEISGMGLQGVGGFLITDIASQREGMAGLGAKAFRFGPCMSAPRVWPGARRVSLSVTCLPQVATGIEI